MAERGRLHAGSVQDKALTQFEITMESLEAFLYGKKQTHLVDAQGKEMGKRKRDDVEEGRRKLQSLWCEECCKQIQGECPIHQSSPSKSSYAVGSFPSEVYLCISSIPEYTHGACAAKRMPRGTWIGPYEGKRVPSDQIQKDKDNPYVWEIYENGHFSHFIDGSDENISSWMRFIRCARHKREQNMSVIQYGRNIYYYAIRDIEIGEEMLVWYHESYHQFWGVPLALAHELDEKNGPPVPPGILQPTQMVTRQSTSPNNSRTSPNNSNNSPGNPGILSQQCPKSFQFPKTPPSKGYSPPTRVPHTPGLSKLPVKPDSSLSPVGQQPPRSEALPYPQVPPVSQPYPPQNVSMPYPPLTRGTTPYQPKSKSSVQYSSTNVMPYPPPMTPQSTPYSYASQTRYRPTTQGTVEYQPTPTQYQVKPPLQSQIVQRPALLERHREPSQQLPSSPRTLATTQIPQQSSPETKMMQDSFPRGLRVSQHAITESPPVIQQLVTQSSRPEHQHIVPSSCEQKVRAYYESESYTARPNDRSSTSSETDQWEREVKENMPIVAESGRAVIESELKSTKPLQASKTTPLQNVTPSIHNKLQIPTEQTNQVSSTVRTVKDHDISWTCGQCGEMFAQQVTLRMHVCSKTAENPFHCGHCSDAFSTSAELREHVVTHSNDRPFKCGFCGRSFAGATTLGNHMRTHTGQRPYECKVCGQTFAIATQLSRHLRPPGECGQKLVNGYNQSVDITVEQ